MQFTQAPICNVDGCEKDVLARAMCRAHYKRFMRYGTTTLPERVPRSQRPLPCQIEGCEAPRHQYQRYCGSHYMKWYRHGDPFFQQTHDHADLTGERFGMLTAVSYTPATDALPPTWLCKCDCGTTTSVRTGDLNSGNITSCGDPKHRWQDDVEYGAAHCRVRFHRGSASAQSCVDCGAAAAHWSYDHADPDERTSTTVKGNPAYSLKIEHYVPRCVPCHKAFDLARLAA